MDNDSASTPTLMRRIAEALGIPPERFLTRGETSDGLGEASECLRLWCELKTADDRRRGLESLRKLVDDGNP